jgi:2-hydroxy-6-oxonona-2,4-dienedioate hydrolase
MLRRIVVALIVCVFSAGAFAANPDGSIAGLKAKFVDVGGVRTRYYEYGQGEPLVLVHGEGWSGHSSANTWSKVIPGLAKSFHVFAADKLGSGMTGNPVDDKDYNIQGEVDHMYRFIQTMKLGKVHLVGQSRGGGLVFFLSVEHPEIVRTLVIIDSLTAAPAGPNTRQETLAACPKEPDFEEWKCRIRAISFKPDAAFDDEFFEAGRYMASLPKSHETIAKMKAGAGGDLADTGSATSGFNAWKKNWHDRVQNESILQMPILLYWGHNDPSAVLARGQALYEIVSAKNPNVRMITVNKAGHFHYREYPDEFVYNITNWIHYWEKQPAAVMAGQ